MEQSGGGHGYPRVGAVTGRACRDQLSVPPDAMPPSRSCQSHFLWLALAAYVSRSTHLRGARLRGSNEQVEAGDGAQTAASCVSEGCRSRAGCARARPVETRSGSTPGACRETRHRCGRRRWSLRVDGSRACDPRRPFEARDQDARYPAAALRGGAQESPRGRDPRACNCPAGRGDLDVVEMSGKPRSSSVRWDAMSSSRGATRRELRAIECLFVARETAFSRFRAGSELNRVNGAAGNRRRSPLFAESLGVALEARRETGGLVDPTLGAHLEAAGYDRRLRAP